ncbi:DUF4345 family protein [Flammeovirga sp. SubArs3]|uniref:DUF4345 family protein n=1 Tax=Flammeovirga sp. SubArs3 TaxID=2995316 RepID=UPI00248C61FF|nr:DUF4345 family protein [Flammeovirga sp. SubArs3]
MEIFKIVVLSLSGALLIFGGIMRVFNPIKSYCLKSYSDNPNLQLEGEEDIFNEMRGGGAVTVIGGLFVLLGVFVSSMELSSIMVAIVLYLGFATGRLLSIGLDGKPNPQIIQGTMAELLFGVLNVISLISILFS